MIALRDEDRRALTAGVMRITKASAVLASAALKDRWDVLVPRVATAPWRDEHLWDGNPALDGIRLGLHRAVLAACEQGRAVAELARSSTGYTVVLATLTRGSIEAMARVNWTLDSGSESELLVRHASLEFGDLRYPVQHGLRIRQQGRGGESWSLVADYRRGIETFLLRYGLAIKKAGLTELATGLLSEIYNEAPRLYSGLSAAAHGQGWATGNFFDLDQGRLVRDDQMVIEYCAYVIETIAVVTSKLTIALAADRASVERWTSEREQVDLMLRTVLKRRDSGQPDGASGAGP